MSQVTASYTHNAHLYCSYIIHLIQCLVVYLAYKSLSNSCSMASVPQAEGSLWLQCPYLHVWRETVLQIFCSNLAMVYYILHWCLVEIVFTHYETLQCHYCLHKNSYSKLNVGTASLFDMRLGKTDNSYFYLQTGRVFVM